MTRRGSAHLTRGAARDSVYALIVREYGISVSTFVNASIGALVVAKVMLVVGVLPLGPRKAKEIFLGIRAARDA